MELPIGGGNTRVKRHSGYEVPEHPGGGLAGRSWSGCLLNLVPLGYPGGGLVERSWISCLLDLVPLGYPGRGLARRS